MTEAIRKMIERAKEESAKASINIAIDRAVGALIPWPGRIGPAVDEVHATLEAVAGVYSGGLSAWEAQAGPAEVDAMFDRALAR